MNLARKVHCLDPAVCDEIVQAVKTFEFNRSPILTDGDIDIGSIRTSTSTSLNRDHDSLVHHALNEALNAWSVQINNDYPLIADCLKLPGVTYDLNTCHEGLGVLKYEPGQKYDWHTDAPIIGFGGDFDAKNRLISCVLYLNDDFTGGYTEMLGRKYKPEKGKVLIFPSNWNYPHRACPVEEGTKYAVVTWYHPTD